MRNIKDGLDNSTFRMHYDQTNDFATLFRISRNNISACKQKQTR